MPPPFFLNERGLFTAFTNLFHFMNLSNFFSQGQNPTQLAAFFVVFLVCWNLENIFGVTRDYKKWRHDFTNVLFVLPGATLQILLGLFFVKVLLYENENQLGLLPQYHLTSNWAQIAVVFIGLDLAYWLYHFLMHKLKAVWRFHAVHHSDLVLNVSTSLREHPVETVIRLGHYMIGTWVLGPAFWIITMHQFIQIVSKIIIHSNFRLPDHIDKYVSMLLITPNMHHVHHHDVEPYTDSNYGDLFSIWDRMFGTFRYLPAHEVSFGLDIVQPETQKMDFINLIKLPFDEKELFQKSPQQRLLEAAEAKRAAHS